MWWIGPMWPKCAFGDQKGLIWKEAMPFGNLSSSCDKKIVDLFLLLLVKKGGSCHKTVISGVLDRV